MLFVFLSPSLCLIARSCTTVPVGTSSRGGDVTVYVWHKPTELAHSFSFCSCVYFCLYGPFNCISFHQFFQLPSVFWLCSSGLISALLVLSTLHLFMKVSFSPDLTPSGWLGWKESTNSCTHFFVLFFWITYLLRLYICSRTRPCIHSQSFMYPHTLSVTLKVF